MQPHIVIVLEIEAGKAVRYFYRKSTNWLMETLIINPLFGSISAIERALPELAALFPPRVVTRPYIKPGWRFAR